MSGSASRAEAPHRVSWRRFRRGGRRRGRGAPAEGLGPGGTRPGRARRPRGRCFGHAVAGRRTAGAGRRLGAWQPLTATTKADGLFRFEAAPPRRTGCESRPPALATSAAAGARGSARAPARDGARPGAARQRDPRRSSHSGQGPALVRFEGRTQTTRWVATRPDGSFLLDGAPREPGSLVADGGELRPCLGRWSPQAPAEPVAIALAPTATLAGRVVEADSSKPLGGVRLVARGEGAPSSRRAPSPRRALLPSRGWARAATG